MRRLFSGFFIVISLLVPFTAAVDPAATGQAGQGSIAEEFDATGIDIVNGSIPSQYAVTPSLIDVKVEVSGTSFPGPKGEMAAGPRSIGFTADPASLLIIIIIAIAISAGILYLMKRKPAESGMDDAEETNGK